MEVSRRRFEPALIENPCEIILAVTSIEPGLENEGCRDIVDVT